MLRQHLWSPCVCLCYRKHDRPYYSILWYCPWVTGMARQPSAFYQGRKSCWHNRKGYPANTQLKLRTAPNMKLAWKSVKRKVHLALQLALMCWRVVPTQSVEGKPLSMVGTPTHLSHLGSFSALSRGPLEPPKISKPWSLSCLRPAPPLKPSAALGYREVRGRWPCFAVAGKTSWRLIIIVRSCMSTSSVSLHILTVSFKPSTCSWGGGGTI